MEGLRGKARRKTEIGLSKSGRSLGQLLEGNQTMDCEESPRGQMNSGKKKQTLKPDMMAHAFNPSTHEEEAGRSL